MIALLALELSAQATVPDSYGAGGRAIGMGGGGIAVVDDGSAAAINPAGLYQIRRPTVSLGFSEVSEKFAAVPALYWDTNRDGIVDDLDTPLDYSAGVDDAAGFHFAAGRNVGGKFGVGVSGYVPATRLLRFSTFEPELPTYIQYDNRPQRYTLAVGVGGQPIRGLAIGAGIDFVPAARYSVALTIDATITGTENPDGTVDELVGNVNVDVHEMDLDLVPGFAPTVGVQLDFGEWSPKLKGFWLAAAYRGSVGLPISVDLDLQANVRAEDIGDLDPFIFAAILEGKLALFDHYVPAMLTLGAAYRAEDTFSTYIDIRQTMWRRMTLNVARVEDVNVTSPLVELDDFVTDGNAYDVTLRNTISIRTGLELRLPEWKLDSDLRYIRLYVRGGFQWEPTPLVSQGTNSAFLDADRMGVAAGIGFETWDPWELVDGPVRFDVFAQYHTLLPSTLAHNSDVPAEGFPIDGAGIPIGGQLLVVGGSWGFDY